MKFTSINLKTIVYHFFIEFFPFHVHYVGERRSPVEEFFEFSDMFLVSLGIHFDIAVVEIAHCTANIVPGGRADGRIPEGDALYPSLNDIMICFHGAIICENQSRGQVEKVRVEKKNISYYI